jgi:hypothetical protein
MRFQLVIQFEANTLEDFDQLVEFEGNLAEELGGTGEVDGHDFGSSEFNIFVLTNEPLAAFERSQKLVRNQKLRSPIRVAYREVTGEYSVTLWPPRADRV